MATQTYFTKAIETYFTNGKKDLIIIHHNDADGRMAGYLYLNHYKNTNQYENICTIETDYGNDKLIDQIKKKTSSAKTCEIAVLDFSLSFEEMDAIDKDSFIHCTKMIWIDHHRTAIKKYRTGYKEKGYTFKIAGVQVEGISGCELTYLYLKHDGRIYAYTDGIETKLREEYEYKNTLGDNIIFSNIYEGQDTCLPFTPDEEKILIYNWKKVGMFQVFDVNCDLLYRNIPYSIRLIGDRDCWRNKYEESAYFAIGLRAHWLESDLSKPVCWSFWNSIVSRAGAIEEIVLEGHIISKYNYNNNTSQLNKDGSEVFMKKFPDLKIIAINSSASGSGVFSSVFNQYEVGIIFTYSLAREVMTFSIYRLGLNPEKNIDCGAIAASFGGGGHPGAAGFRTSGTLPFKPVKK